MSGASFESLLLELVREAGGPASLSYLMLRGEPSPIVLVFERGADKPVFVFKGARDDGVLIENSKLKDLRESAPEAFRRTLPRPLGSRSPSATMHGVLTSVLPGTRLKDLSPERVFGENTADGTLREVSEWLVGYQRAADGLRSKWGAGDRRGLLEEPAENYLRWFRSDAAERNAIGDAVRRLPDPGSEGFPHCLGHGDFSPANVLWDDGRIGVVDFEMALQPCLPLEDLFHFLASMKSTTSARNREGQRRGFFEEAFYGEGFLACASRRAVQTLSTTIGVDPDLTESLFILSWVRFAVGSLGYWVRSLGCEELLDDRERLWQRLDAETEEFLPVARIGGGVCGNVRQHLEMRDRFRLLP